MRWKVLLGVFGVGVLLAGTAVAGSRWLITSTRQIKPSVIKQLRGRFAIVEGVGGEANMCPGGAGSCDVAASDARCPGGVVTGGGFDGGSSPPIGAFMGYNEPDRDGRGWHIVMGNAGGEVTTFRTVAICAGVVPGRAADTAATGPRAVSAQIEGELATMRTRLARR
jgi:hypothetical protein